MNTKILDIDAELERDGIIQKVKLRFLLKPVTVDEEDAPLRYEIDKGLGFTPAANRRRQLHASLRVRGKARGLEKISRRTWETVGKLENWKLKGTGQN